MANNKKTNKPIPKPIVKEETPAVTQEVVKEEPEYVDAEVYGVDSLLNVRSTPEVKEDNVIMTLKKGTKIQVVDPKKAKGCWYRIVITDPVKTNGYVMKKYIKII